MAEKGAENREINCIFYGFGHYKNVNALLYTNSNRCPLGENPGVLCKAKSLDGEADNFEKCPLTCVSKALCGLRTIPKVMNLKKCAEDLEDELKQFGIDIRQARIFPREKEYHSGDGTEVGRSLSQWLYYKERGLPLPTPEGTGVCS